MINNDVICNEVHNNLYEVHYESKSYHYFDKTTSFVFVKLRTKNIEKQQLQRKNLKIKMWAKVVSTHFETIKSIATKFCYQDHSPTILILNF